MIGTGELIVILALATLLFGGKKIPELAKNLGLGIREFKRALYGNDEESSGKISGKISSKIESIPKEKSPLHDEESP